METLVIRQGEPLSPAIDAVLRGEVIAVPTETVYGLACDAFNGAAVRKIYELKGRPEEKPLSVLVSGALDAERLCEGVPDCARALAERFWPGPLTMVLRRAKSVPDIVTAGGSTLGVRCPDSALTLEIIRSGAPLAAPSANPSDMPSARSIGEVLAYFDKKLPVAVDGGECGLGIESTVLDLTVSPPRILRRGALSKRDVKNACGIVPQGVTVLGITGPTGSGKTTALRALKSLGVTTIDCDEVYHGLVGGNGRTGDTEMLAELEARFDGVVKDFSLDRPALGAIVFSDEAALNDLNAITHKYVDREVFKVLRALEASGGVNPVVAIDAIALVESGLGARCDSLTAVIAPREKRVGRVMRRDGIDEARAVSRIDAQKPDAFYENACDATLYNNGGENEFFERCTAHFKKVLEEFQ